jgi:hypothetical protein
LLYIHDPSFLPGAPACPQHRHHRPQLHQ